MKYIRSNKCLNYRHVRCALGTRCLDTPRRGSYVLFQCLTAPGLTSPWTFFTAILIVVERFSKMLHFIPLPKLPSLPYFYLPLSLSCSFTPSFSLSLCPFDAKTLPPPKNMAEVMFWHVFRLHGFPKDAVSVQGLQFAACFWKALCSLLGPSVSLTSRYYL